MRERLWSIVLAGGEGERMRPLVERWLGRHRPKQYCAFIGTRSMFQHTIDRADQLTPAKRRVIVAAASHEKEVHSQLRGRAAGRLLFQPFNRGTVAGILLPLACVRASDPEATVVIYPSDHFVWPEERFLESVLKAALVLERLPNRLILIAVPPEGPEQEYGWIQPGAFLTAADHGVRGIQSFVEKPARRLALEAIKRGALWNTFIVIARVGKLWELGWRHFPQMMAFFESYPTVIGSGEERPFLESVYRSISAADFSMDLLTRIPGEVAVVPLTEVIWSDWGKPERIARSLLKIGKPPVFPAELLRLDWN